MNLIVWVLTLLVVNAKPYSKIVKEVEEWGVIPQGLIVDDTENIHLEDFYSPNSVDLRSNAKKMVRNLSLGLALPTNGSRVSMDEFYEQSVANLKAEMPQLRWVKLHDGYTYFPENGTVEQLEDELRFLKHHLQRIARILHGNGIDIEENEAEFHVNFLFNKDIILKSQFRQIMLEEYEFRVEDSEMINECRVEMHPKIGKNFNLHIELNFADHLSPFIRTTYPRDHSTRRATTEAITQGRISSRIAGVLLSTLMGNRNPFMQCRI